MLKKGSQALFKLAAESKHHLLVFVNIDVVLNRLELAWLKEKFGVEIDFEVSDALNKLEGLGFLTQKDTKIAVCPLDGALSRLDMLWDRLYDFSTGDAAKQTAIRA